MAASLTFKSPFTGFFFLLILLTITAPTTAQTYSTPFQNVTWDESSWTLTTTNPLPGTYQSRMSLANGYLGISLSSLGPFFEVDTPVDGDQISGWPLFTRRQAFATISGFWNSQPTTNGSNFPWLYQYGGESVIAGVPHWAGLTVTTDSGMVLNASVDVAREISNFSSSMDFQGGVLTWAYTWTPEDDVAIGVEYTALVHKLNVNQAAVQLRLTASQPVTVTVTDVLDGDGAVRTDFADKGADTANGSVIWTAVRPTGIANVTAYIYSTLAVNGSTNLSTTGLDKNLNGNQSSIAQYVQVALSPGAPITFSKYIGAASSDAFVDPQSIARNASSTAARAGFDSLLATHRAEWASILTVDAVDSYALDDNGTLPDDADLVTLHITSVTNPYQLLQNTVGPNAIALAAGDTDQLNVNSVSVGGLGSDSYAGLVFWDADIWMSSGLVVAFPHAAEAMANYRARLLGQAKANVDMAFSSSQNASGKFSSSGAVYPWTSGRFGNCTGTGPCFDYEYHINGDVGLDLLNYYVVTGDEATFGDQYWPVYEGIAVFYSELVTLNESTGLYVLTNATDPDEYANFVDNPGYTMALIETHLQTASNLSSIFSSSNNASTALANAVNIAKRIDVPVDQDANIILEYSTMNGSISVKQADVVLIDDFLPTYQDSAHSLANLDYYASRQSANGPAMTYAIFATLANTLSPSGCSAYTYALDATLPYLRGPWFQYSEQLIDDYSLNGGTHPAFPFLTAAGGANRVAVYAWLGLQLRLDALYLAPHLPPQIPQVRYRQFYWQGQAIRASSNATHTIVTRLSASDALQGANEAFTNTAIPIVLFGNTTTTLAPNATLTIANRILPSNSTSNLAECAPVVANASASTAPGQFPLAANDGAASTKWQPASPNDTATLTIDLGTAAQGQRVSAFKFDWAQAPPEGFYVAFSNVSATADTDTNSAVVVVVREDAVVVSAPWDAAAAAEVVPYTSNTTNVSVAAAWAGRWVTLGIWGTQGPEGVGATVAEFEVVVGGNGASGGGGGGGGGSSTSMGVGKGDGRCLYLILTGLFTVLLLQ